MKDKLMTTVLVIFMAGICPIDGSVASEFSTILSNEKQTSISTRCNEATRCGDGICEYYLGETVENCSDCQDEPVIVDAMIVTDPIQPIVPSHGDLWFSTWGADDTLYMSWGDGTGPGFGWIPELNTDLGIAQIPGDLPDLECLPVPGGCIRSRHVPMGVPDVDDKPSSLLSIGNQLILAAHSPLGEPNLGYLAVSEDHGATWTRMENSPWIKSSEDRAFSYFRCLMFINMGQNYELNTDGYVYAFGIGWEWDWDIIHEGKVYLARVPVHAVLDYESYQYFTGNSPKGPEWSELLSDAAPVPGLCSSVVGSAMYHQGTGRFIFMNMEGLFEARNPWGPWTMIAPLFFWADLPAWQGGYMPGLISKGAGLDDVWFTLSGQDRVIEYRLHIGRINLVTRSRLSDPLPTDKSGSPVSSPDIHQPTPKATSSMTRTNRSVIHVPQDYPTIQDGIDAMQSGDTLILSDGTYTGEGNRGLLVTGDRPLTIQSESGPENCIIDCERESSGFTIMNNRSTDLILRGITVRNAYTQGSGAGIRCINASPFIDNCHIACSGALYQGSGVLCYGSHAVINQCLIRDNTGGSFGGGICILGGSFVTIQFSTIQGNRSRTAGGGIFCEGSDFNLIHSTLASNTANYGGGIGINRICDSKIFNCLFKDNHATSRGGAIFYDSPYPAPDCSIRRMIIENCTITENSAGFLGGGFFGERALASDLQLRNSILWANEAPSGSEMAFRGSDHPSVIHISYCNIPRSPVDIFQDTAWTIAYGGGMLSEDPLFIDGPNGEIYLSNRECGQPVNSPCIDSGSDSSNDICSVIIGDRLLQCMNSFSTRVDSEPDGGVVDMGVHYLSNNPLYLPSTTIWSLIVLLACITGLLGYGYLRN